jgi:hypothetical protein
MIVEYPLRWPEGWPRSNSHEWGAASRQGSRLDKTSASRSTRRKQSYGLSSLRLGARDAVLHDEQRRARAGVALYFTMNGRQMAMACDRFDTRAANTRSLGLAIEAMRQLERHGGGAMVERAFAGFRGAAASADLLAGARPCAWRERGRDPRRLQGQGEPVRRRRQRRHGPARQGARRSARKGSGMTMRVIEGGGFRFLTEDPVLTAVVKRCAELECQIEELRHIEVARFRTLRRDVKQIKRSVVQQKVRAVKETA